MDVEALESLTPSDLVGIEAISYSTKGAASHIEVICRIKGIRLIRKDGLDVVPNSTSVTGFDGYFQLSATGALDLERLDLSRVRSVFVRFEHLLYEAMWDDPRLLNAGREATLASLLASKLDALAQMLPATTTLVVRGLDLRSDDPLLAIPFRRSAEANPELGVHGASWLLRNPHWVDIEQSVLDSLNHPVAYGLPFTRNVNELADFVRQHPGFSHVVPFLETPQSLLDFARNPVGVQAVSIGLKDLVQFFAAIDRTSADLADEFDYLNPVLVDFVTGAVRALASAGIQVSLYQQQDTLELYASLLDSVVWTPSMAAQAFPYREDSS